MSDFLLNSSMEHLIRLVVLGNNDDISVLGIIDNIYLNSYFFCISHLMSHLWHFAETYQAFALYCIK